MRRLLTFTILLIVAFVLYLPMTPASAQQVGSQGAQLTASTVSLQSVNFPDRYLVAKADGSAIELLPVPDESDSALKKRAEFIIVPGLADAAKVSLQVNDSSGRYVVATTSGVVLQLSNNIGNLSDATFNKLAGLAGSGASFESLSNPNHYLRHSGFVLRLNPLVDTQLFREDSSFVEVAPLGSKGSSACIKNVAESADYRLVYRLQIPVNSDYNNALVPYAVDNSATVGAYNRVAYCLELDGNWVWVSMDDFTNGTIKHTGVPVASVNPNGFQRKVTNMNVASNVAGIVTGNGIATGNLEFWQNCYNSPAQLGLAGASNDLFDFDDTINNNGCTGWGSMQVHNYGAQQTLLAYNGWDIANEDELGIGNRATSHPDWTFSANATSYTIRNLWVYVLRTCSQADFLAAVQAGEASGTITLDGSCRYLLSSASDNQNAGSGAFIAKATVVEGNGAIIEREANAPAFRILGFKVPNGAVMRNVTIRNGRSNSNGGGIVLDNTSLTLENVVFASNEAQGDGGAIYSSGHLVLRNVTIKDSVADWGGAVNSYTGTLTIDNSHLINNRAKGNGGAIFKETGALDITDTVFAQNRSDTGKGAALFIGGSATDAKMTNSTITDNAGNVGPAIIQWAPFTLRNTIIANHSTALLAGGAVSEDYNLFANTTVAIQESKSAVVNRGAHSIQVLDPQFIDPAALNYALKKSSPSVDRGTNAVLASAPNLAKDAANLVRPFSGTNVDIGAYELQAEGGPSLSIVKQGPPWLAAGSAITYSLTIANDGVRNGDALEVVDVLPVGAEYVANSATANGSFVNGRLTWQIGTLAPGQHKFIQYSVKASQALVSADYRVQSTTDLAVIAQGKVITSPLNARLVAAMNFFPQPDGFSFPNYSDSSDSDLTVDDMIKIFGKEAACIADTPSCVLRATVEEWRKQSIEGAKGGHCAGFSIGSLDIFANPIIAPNNFQSGASLTYDLAKANARNYIMLYWSAQALLSKDPPKYERFPAKTSIDVLNTLITNFKDPNAADRYRLGIARYDEKGNRVGHSVVPFAVEKLKDDANDYDYLIYVYDNNYPNDNTRAIRINRETGVWSYVTALNPNEPSAPYKGTKDSGTIALVSWQSDHTFPKVCYMCPSPNGDLRSSGAAEALQSGGTVEFQLDGEGYLLVTRSDGKKVGFELTSGQWISEIEGAEVVDILTGLGLHIPPAIRIPHETGKTYRIQVANGDTAYGNTEASVNVNMLGPGFAIRLTDLVLNSPIPQPVSFGDDGSVQATAVAEVPADLMNLNFAPDTKRIAFETGEDDAETPSLSLAVSRNDDSDYSIDVKNVSVDKGHAVALAFNEANQSITIEDNSAGQTNFQVEVKRINRDGTTDTFVSDNVSDDGKAGVTLNVGTGWTGDAPQIQVEAESTLLTPGTGNQGNKVFLPITRR